MLELLLAGFAVLLLLLGNLVLLLLLGNLVLLLLLGSFVLLLLDGFLLLLLLLVGLVVFLTDELVAYVALLLLPLLGGVGVNGIPSTKAINSRISITLYSFIFFINIIIINKLNKKFNIIII